MQLEENKRGVFNKMASYESSLYTCKLLNIPTSMTNTKTDVFSKWRQDVGTVLRSHL